MVLLALSVRSANETPAPEVVRIPPRVVGPVAWERPPWRSSEVAALPPRLREPVL